MNNCESRSSPEEVCELFFNVAKKCMNFPYVFVEEDYISWLCTEVITVFSTEASLLSLEPPIIVCGDTHGQFIDTLRIFELMGKPDQNKYIFLGDYVDRGGQSIENLVFLLTLKVLYPTNVYLIRGNHETEEISTVYGLRDECIRRYSFSMYSKFIAVFDIMPFCATISKSIFCVHGGIPSESISLSDISQISRPYDLNSNTQIIDILWSDPNSEAKGFIPSPRGVSFLFGQKEAEEFMRINGISLIIRSHEFCSEGIAFPFGQNGGLITVFSAPNYCRTMNTASVLTIKEDLEMKITLFKPHYGDKA